MENPSPVERATNIMQCRMPWSQAQAVAEDLDRADLLVDEREFDLAVRVGKLEGFAHWLLALDEPGNKDRRTVTLTRIIDRARKALGE